MPELDISDGHGNLNPLARLTVKAVMRYPGDSPEEKKARFDLVRLGTYQKISEEGKKIGDSEIPGDLRDIRSLLELFESGVGDQDPMSFQRGRIAGRILLLLGIAARDLPEGASVNRAIAFLLKLQKSVAGMPMSFGLLRTSKSTDGKPWTFLRPGNFQAGERAVVKQNRKPKQSRHPLTNTSEQPLRGSWREFRAVAHLFAAHELLSSLLISRGSLHPRIGAPMSFQFDESQYLWGTDVLVRKKGKSDLLSVLADAECLRQFGVNHVPPGSEYLNTPTLDPDLTWQVPPDIQLPEPMLANNLPSWVEFIVFCRDEYRA